MSVKKRILISNIIMLVILLALVMVLSFYVMRVFISTYIRNDVKSIEIPEENVTSFSVYELQILFDGMIDMVSESNMSIKNHEDYQKIDSYISKTGSKSYILLNGNVIYVNGGKDANEIYSEAVLLNETISQNKKTILYSDSDCFLYSTSVKINSTGDHAEILLFNDHVGTMEFRNENSKYWQDAANNIYDAVKSITIIGSAIIIIISFALIVAVSNSIMSVK